MFDPELIRILGKMVSYGVCGSLAAAIVWFFNRRQPRPRLEEAAAVGFLVGAAFGAMFGIFESMLVR